MASFAEVSIGFKAVFQKTFNETKSEAEVLATRIFSTDLSEKYVWLGNFPAMKEWVGDKAVKQLKDYGYQIANKSYESTVSVPNKHIELDKIGLYKPMIEQNSQEAKRFSSDLIASLLIAGEANDCYDGKKYFASNHIIGEGSTVVTYKNVDIGVLDSTKLLAKKAEMMGIKSAEGKSLRVNPNLLVCGALNLANATKAIKGQTLSGGESNPTYEMFELLVLPEIADESWYLFDTTKIIKPFILQIVEDGKFTSSNDRAFMRDEAMFSVEAFKSAGYGLWQFAYKMKKA